MKQNQNNNLSLKYEGSSSSTHKQMLKKAASTSTLPQSSSKLVQKPTARRLAFQEQIAQMQALDQANLQMVTKRK